MEYPYTINLIVKNIFGDKKIPLTLYSGITTFVGTNASGKTQTLKALRDTMRSDKSFVYKVRYLSSNRIGTMEPFRSKTDAYSHDINHFDFGGQETKSIRKQIETATGDFFSMDDRKDIFIKVSERLSELFNRHIYIRWNAGNMQVYFEKTNSEHEYSVALEASGLVNIISILAALFDEEVEVLLIDEPEVSLHPQLQSYLLREMKNATNKFNKTIIISTHSSEMIELNKPSDLCNFVFFRKDSLPIQISPDTLELQNAKLKEFILRMSIIYNQGFFAKKVLLIEGSSDMIICRYLCNRLNLNLDVASSQIIPVEGKGQFPVITKLFRLIGKDVCILTDLDGFTDDNDIINLFSNLPQAKEIANHYGSADLQTMIRDIKSNINTLIQNNKDNMISIYEMHPYWINRDTDVEENKIIQRAVIAQLFSVTSEVLSTWPNSKDWISLKTRITALLEILEQLGCFILRKGAIESYYAFSPNTTFNGKPSAAADEVSHWERKSDKELKDNFSDIVHSLEFAALDNKIDESLAVKHELLSELPLILGILNEQSTEKELWANIKQTKGSAKSLFNYKIINEKNRFGVEISIKSTIIDVYGFPFKAFVGDDVINIINNNIQSNPI